MTARRPSRKSPAKVKWGGMLFEAADLKQVQQIATEEDRSMAKVIVRLVAIGLANRRAR